MSVTCFSVKQNIICWFLWGPIHYDALHDILVEAGHCLPSIPTIAHKISETNSSFHVKSRTARKI